jgi:hypothetical protein
MGYQYYNLLHDDGLRKKPHLIYINNFKKNPPYLIYKKKDFKKFQPTHFTWKNKNTKF